MGLRAEELRPGRSGSPGRGVDSGGVQDLPDGGGADLVAESGEFAVDAAVAPGGVLGGQAQDQGTDAGGDGGSAGPGVLGGPAAGDELAVPAQDRRWGDQQAAAACSGSSRARAAITARSVQRIRGRGVRRCSTASWWRRTRISISLACRSGRAAPSSSGAWRTSDRSASAPPADHAGTRPATNRQVNRCAQRFGHPHRGGGVMRLEPGIGDLPWCIGSKHPAPRQHRSDRSRHCWLDTPASSSPIELPSSRLADGGWAALAGRRAAAGRPGRRGDTTDSLTPLTGASRRVIARRSGPSHQLSRVGGSLRDATGFSSCCAADDQSRTLEGLRRRRSVRSLRGSGWPDLLHVRTIT